MCGLHPRRYEFLSKGKRITDDHISPTGRASDPRGVFTPAHFGGSGSPPTLSLVPRRRIGALLIAVASASLAAAAPAIAADPVLIYAPSEGAREIHDALGDPTRRQAPVLSDARWPRSRLVGKVAGRDLADRDASEIAATLRAGWRHPEVGGRVAIDEVNPNQWTAAGAQALRTALTSLGTDAQRVVVYAAPSLVEQVGRTDPRDPLDEPLGALVDAVSLAGDTYLVTYRGDLQPFPHATMAAHLTRWSERWPDDRGELHLLIGPDGGIGQAALWDRVRSSPAGRELLASGPGAYRPGAADAGRAWAQAYERHRADPTAAASGGDVQVPIPGGLTLTAGTGRSVLVTASRPGRVVVTLTAAGGGPRRAIRKLATPTAGPIAIALPGDARPGRYVVEAVLEGSGLIDRQSVAVTLARPRGLRLRYGGGVFTLTVPRGTRAILRIQGPRIAPRAIAKVTGPATRRIRRPRQLRPGRYVAIAVTPAADGRQEARARFRIPRRR